ncbi:hypothetical protein JQN58_23395 [Aneurinibacillus sp. BA2021]|nr:hypothetical protein [Aneurinibacillus sp. BA2021]
MTIPARYLAFDEQLRAMHPGMASGAVLLAEVDTIVRRAAVAGSVRAVSSMIRAL